MRRKTRLPWNWRSRVEITRHDEPAISYARGRTHLDGSVQFTMSFKTGQTPKGFARHIGQLDICDKSPYFVEDVELDDYFHKRGLGTLLYLHALNELGSLTTHYHSSSSAAKGLWRRLVRRLPSHRVDFFEGTLTIFPKKLKGAENVLECGCELRRLRSGV